MDLRQYVESIHQQLEAAAQAGGDDARALADRLVAPLDAAIRLALQDVLAAAAEEITTELAPGSVELRLRGRNPEFVVTPPAVDAPLVDQSDGAPENAPDGWRAAADGGDGAMARINLRMPIPLKARIDQAADGQGISVNSWVVRALAAALDRGDPGPRPAPRAPHSAQHYTGWAR
jgi:hypothetical protein